ncbi:LUD domain-containing protein [Halostella sp. JP-L12]|uniref:LUD domain-containing protein n=1 Tax=Halostella TaxID=1843185 RepID=UPI000EF7C04E|nr:MULTISPECIES: LUD domain-containing protein [Halostella]NHN49419.1 LUD domain-containing protein [Halostella sp. JP-L12]
METGTIQEFQQSLSSLDTASTVVSADEFEAGIADVIETPAVGAELPFDDLSLSETPVTLDPSPAQLRGATTGVTGSRMGITSLGTVAVESREEGDEFVALYPERHVAVVRERDLEADLSDAFGWLRNEFEAGRQSFILATGPSSTGDMGALVQGVHGPEHVHIVIVRDNE